MPELVISVRARLGKTGSEIEHQHTRKDLDAAGLQSRQHPILASFGKDVPAGGHDHIDALLHLAGLDDGLEDGDQKFRGDAVMRASRAPDILADAAHAIFLKDAKTFTGNFLIDDTFLFSNGVRDFDRYRVDPGVDLEPDFFVCQTTRHRRSA